MVVDVIDEGVQRPDALFETARDFVPFPLQDESGDDVERPLAIDVGTVVIDRERDAHGADGEFRSGLAFRDLFVGERRQRPQQPAGPRTRFARPRYQLIPKVLGHGMPSSQWSFDGQTSTCRWGGNSGMWLMFDLGVS